MWWTLDTHERQLRPSLSASLFPRPSSLRQWRRISPRSWQHMRIQLDLGSMAGQR
jgi:hypothetical protein